MTSRILPDPVVRMTQFYIKKTGDVRFFGSCGQTALAVCMAVAQSGPESFEGVGELMIRHTEEMIAKGIAGTNGASTLAALAQQARDSGLDIAHEITYREPLMTDWRRILNEEAGVRPILLQVANGQALTDAETGKHDEEGLRYHAFAIVGVQDNGYIATDGDHPEVTRRFQIYDEAILAASQPCGMLVFVMQH